MATVTGSQRLLTLSLNSITIGGGSVTSSTISNWNTAYSWGNHASAGYLTSVPDLDASKITTGTFAAARIPSLAASKITSGTFAAARIPNLAASKITSGTFDPVRIPTLSQYIRSDQADTATGKITFSGGIDGFDINNGISGTNFNITGVNQLNINDPGEGIVFGGGSNNVSLYAIDDSADNKMNFGGANQLQVNGRRVFEANYHPNADKLTTARTIAGTSFDGTANISINYNNLTNKPTIPSVGNGTLTVTAGTALTGGGSFTANQSGNSSVTINHGDTSSQSSVNNSGNTVIQDITLDTHGHITGITSKALSIPAAPANATITVSAGTDLTGGGNFTTNQSSNETITINHEDVSSQGSVNNSGGTVIQDVTLNANGHVTGLGSVNLDSRYTSIDHFRHTGHGNYTSTTTSALLTEALGDDAFDSKLTAHKTSWSYAGNGDLTDAGRLTELAGTSWLWWTDDSSDNVQGNVTALAIAPNTGGSAGKVFIYNNQGSSYAPGWREVWTSTSDGAGSGLDADLLDGQQGSHYLNYNNLSNKPSIPSVGNGTLTVSAGTSLSGGGSFTANQSGNSTVTLNVATPADAPSSWSDVVAWNGSLIKDTAVEIHGSGYLRASYLNMSHGVGTRSSDTIFYSSTDDYIRKTNATGMRAALDIYTKGQVDALIPTVPSVGNGTLTVSAGTSLTGGGSFTANQSGNSTVTINHADTSTQSSVNNSGNAVIQDITLDTHGHITGIASTTLSIPDTSNMVTTNTAQTISGAKTFTANVGVSGNVSANFYAFNGAYVNATSDVRAPIFYDRNNTGYYVHADNESVLNAVRAHHFRLSTGDGKGLRFWNSDSYKIYMSAVSNSTHGGRAPYESTSDYNMYFRMTGGTNRGFVFRSDTTNVAGIDSSGNFNTSGLIKTGNGAASAPAYAFTADYDSGMFSLGTNAIGFSTGGTQRLKINSNGLLLTGSSSLWVNGQQTITNTRDIQNVVNYSNTDGHMTLTRTGNAPLILNRKGTGGATGSSRGEIQNFKSGSVKIGRIGYAEPYGSNFYFAAGDWGLGLYSFSSARYVQPSDHTGAVRDNQVDLGSSSARFDDVYATNGTIQTSDRNEKQDIQALTDAETRAAVTCKGLMRRFRWVDSVAEKGDEARYHFGAIAQDVEAAFTAEGLDAGDYGLFIRTTWWEHEGDWYPEADVAPEGSIEKTRLGIRYNQLFAFIIGAL